MTEAVKFLKTSPLLTSWDTTHGVQAILNLEMALLHTMAVKVESLHGTVTNTDTATDHLQPRPKTVTCITSGDTGHKVLKPSRRILDTTITQTNSDSDGLKSMRIHPLTADTTRTTTGVTITPHTTVDKVHSSLLKDMLVDHTTYV